MSIAPEIVDALRERLRRPAWIWLAVTVATIAGLAGLSAAQHRAQRTHQELQSQYDALQADVTQIAADLELAKRHREDYRSWLADGLIAALPVAEWRAQRLEDLAQALSALGRWATEQVTLELQPGQAWEQTTPAPDVPAAASEGYAVSVHPLRVQATGTDDIHALAAITALERRWRTAGQWSQCRLERKSSGDPPLVTVDWACEARLYYLTPVSKDEPQTAAKP